MNRSRRRDDRMSVTRTIVGSMPVLLLTVSLGLTPVIGCASSPNNGATSTAGTSAAANSTATPAETMQELERRYVVGPIAARELGYRVDWQSLEVGNNVKLFEVSDDSVFALDTRNFLVRLDRETGRRIWRVPVAEPIQEIIGINYIGEKVYLTTGGRLIELDSATGTQTGLQRLEKIANTAPVHVGQFLIYGGRNGQLIWHSHEVAFQWRAYQVSPSINVMPLRVQDDPWEYGYILTVGNDGRVTLHSAESATMLWDKRLLSNVVAPPAATQSAVYVASLDQHLWAYDLYTGRNLWRYLTNTPLSDPPIVIEDRLYQQIPTEGLVCFAAAPLDSPGGQIHWRAKNIKGNVIAKRGNRLFVWHRPDRQLTILDAARGGIVERMHLRQATRLVATDLDGGELYAIGEDGRVVRLLARN